MNVSSGMIYFANKKNFFIYYFSLITYISNHY